MQSVPSGIFKLERRRSDGMAFLNRFKLSIFAICALFLSVASGIGQEFASVWVYRGGNYGASENYGICVDAYSLGQSKEKLDQLFA